jgi:Fe-S-cluster-containing hydrogenase component 2
VPLCSGNPQCVSWCPNHAINFVSGEDFKPQTKYVRGQVVNVEKITASFAATRGRASSDTLKK